MRYYLAVILSLSVFIGLSAQDVIEHGFGIELGGHHGSRRISSGSGQNFPQLQRQDSLESGVAGFSAGFMYTSRVNKIGFTTGLRYLETGYNIGMQPDDFDQERSFTREVKGRYVSVPFELNFYQDITPKNRVFFALGAAAHVHVGTKVTEFTFINGSQSGEADLPEDPEEAFRNAIFSINTSLGLDRKLSERWSVRLEPYFQFFLQGNLQGNFNRFNRNYYQLGARVMVRRFIF